ncbi:hypothetical protein RND81_09G217200 [Saponaria officinalis]|uniref:PRA1 family protein n=1 Tax=Saponaria officinalis TaxID=3572 RepID=A0AAW1IQS2_SAPOF
MSTKTKTTTTTTPNYGTIPTSTPTTASPHSNAPFYTRAIAHRRSWREFLSPSSFSLPTSYATATARIRRNLNYFRFNYSLTTLLILFLSLLYHPISMIVFLSIFVLWIFLYFSRDTPIFVFNRSIDDRVVLVLLFVVTVVALVLTKVGVNVLIALSVALVVVGLHAAFRGVDDLFLDDVDDDDVDGSGLVDVVQGHPLRPTYARVV